MKQWYHQIDYEITNLTQFESLKSELKRRNYEQNSFDFKSENTFSYIPKINTPSNTENVIY